MSSRSTLVRCTPLIIVTSLLWGCRDDGATPGTATVATSASVPIEPRPQGYLGSLVCKECHQEIWESYQTHPMAQSLTVAGESVIEDYETDPDVISPDDVRRYEVSLSGRDVLHREFLLDADGKETCSMEVPVEFAVGSGEHGRSYFINRGGLLFISPVTWYSQQAKWDLSPGYVPGAHKRFFRRASDGCVSCHAGRMQGFEDRFHGYAPSPFAELSVGCERCHGPGREHVALWRSAGPAAAPENDPIVNPARLDHERADSVCLQCHLQGLLRVPRYGAGEFDFRPGDHIQEIWTIFLSRSDALRESSLEAVSQVEQMHASECYRASEGRLQCVTCHDPHRRPDPGDRTAFFRDRCLSCHSGPAGDCSEKAALRISRGDSCVDCHMPDLAAEDVSHTTQTDHRLLRRPTSSSRASQGRSDLQVFGNPEAFLTPVELNRAWGIALTKQAENTGNSEASHRARSLLSPLPGRFPGDPELLEALASCELMFGDRTAAEANLNRVLEYEPNRETALETMFQIAALRQDSEAGLIWVNRLLELNSWNVESHWRKSICLAQLDRWPEAAQAARDALELDPSSTELHEWLQQIYSRLGDQSAAKEQQRRIEQIQSARRFPPSLEP